MSIDRLAAELLEEMRDTPAEPVGTWEARGYHDGLHGWPSDFDGYEACGADAEIVAAYLAGYARGKAAGQ